MLLPLEFSTTTTITSTDMDTKRWLSLMLRISKTGFQTVLQAETHSSLELAMLVLVAHTQVLDTLARDSLRRNLETILPNTTVTPRLGLSHAIQLRIPLPRRTQVVLVRALSQELALSAWVSLKRNLLLNTMVILRHGLSHVIQLRIPLPRRTQVVPVRAHSQELVLNAWALLRRNRDTLLLKIGMLLAQTPTHGLASAMQLRTLLLKRTQAVLELMKKVLVEKCQASVLNARVSLRENLDLLLNIMVTLRNGLSHAIHLKTLLPKRIQVVLALIMDQRLRDLSQVLELNAWDLPREDLENLLFSTMVTPRLGLSHVIQLRILSLRRIQAVPVRALSLVSVLSAWVSLRRNLDLLLNLMMLLAQILTHGLKNAIQTRTLLPRRTQVVPELILMRRKEALSQVSVLNARVLLRENLDPLLNFMMLLAQTPTHGLTNVMQLRTLLPKRIQAVLELMKKRTKDPSQVSELIAKDLLRENLDLSLNLMMSLVQTPTLGSTSAIQLRTLLLRRTQAVLELMKKALVEKCQELVLTAKDSLKLDLETLLALTLTLGLISATQLRTLPLKRTQVVLELMKKQMVESSQESVLIAKDSPKSKIISLTKSSLETAPVSQIAMVPTALKALTAAE